MSGPRGLPLALWASAPGAEGEAHGHTVTQDRAFVRKSVHLGGSPLYVEIRSTGTRTGGIRPKHGRA